MAQDLNKRRIRYTKMGLIAVLLLGFVTQPLLDGEGAVRTCFDVLGAVLVSVCALGRLYCTAFLGGHKNTTLVAHGPFSMVRNPLYFCSFIGVCGVALLSNYLMFIVVVPTLFLSIYIPLIKREELFLAEHFGESYRAYCASVPRLFPNFRLYQAPETVPMQPRFMLYALRDSILWLSILPLFVLIEELHEAGILATYFQLP